MQGAPAQGPGDEPMWSPMSATLIYGDEDAVLVDTLVTFDQVDALADWIEGFGKQLVGIYITHGHSDHWIGISRLRERFGPVPAWARPKVYERAVFEATNPGLSGYWHGVFPGEIPEKPETPDRLDETTIELEGSDLNIIDIGQGDTADSTILHVPSIDAVAGGDVVYNGVQIVVSGHQRVGAPHSYRRNAVHGWASGTGVRRTRHMTQRPIDAKAAKRCASIVAAEQKGDEPPPSQVSVTDVALSPSTHRATPTCDLPRLFLLFA